MISNRTKRENAMRAYCGANSPLYNNYIELCRSVAFWDVHTFNVLKELNLITPETKPHEFFEIASYSDSRLRSMYADSCETKGIGRRKAGNMFGKIINGMEYERINKRGLFRLISHALTFDYETGIDINDTAIIKILDDYYKGLEHEKRALQKEIAKKVNQFFGGRPVTLNALSVFFQINYGLVDVVEASQTISKYRLLTV